MIILIIIVSMTGWILYYRCRLTQEKNGMYELWITILLTRDLPGFRSGSKKIIINTVHFWKYIFESSLPVDYLACFHPQTFMVQRKIKYGKCLFFSIHYFTYVVPSENQPNYGGESKNNLFERCEKKVTQHCHSLDLCVSYHTLGFLHIFK